MFTTSRPKAINKSDNLFYPVTEFYLTILQHGYPFRDIYFSTIFVDSRKNDKRMFYVRFLLPTSRNTHRKNIAPVSLGLYRSAFGLSDGRPLKNIASVK